MTLRKEFQNIEDEGKTWSQIYDLQVKIADEYAIEFLEWFDKNAYSRGCNSFLLWDNDKEPLTSKELLEIFKKEK
jgi:hypothetical protein